MGITKKNIFKTLIQKEIEAKLNENKEKEAEAKTKMKHWRVRKQNAKVGIRPKYMDQLTRKQCNAILETRASMIMVKANYKKGNDNNLDCRIAWQNQKPKYIYYKNARK